MRGHILRTALVGGLSTAVLAGGATATVAAVGGSLSDGSHTHDTTLAATSVATPPALPGTVVDVRLTDMGAAMHGGGADGGGHGAMMGGGYRQMMGGSGYGRMMGGSGYGRMMGGDWHGRMMQVRLSRHTVPAGKVSLRVSDTGVMGHELVVLPLREGATAGHRHVRADGTVNEKGSLGEVSNNNGPGAGEGLQPGGIGWTTLKLPPGHYELVCNLPGQYAAGMHAELDVS